MANNLRTVEQPLKVNRNLPNVRKNKMVKARSKASRTVVLLKESDIKGDLKDLFDIITDDEPKPTPTVRRRRESSTPTK